MSRKIINALKEGQRWWVKLPKSTSATQIEIGAINGVIITCITPSFDGGENYANYLTADVTWLQQF